VGDGRIVIVGGGIGGLALAFRLRQRLPQAGITVLEATERWGGVIRTTREDGLLLEHGPDAILRTKPAGMRLIDDLGLTSEVIGTRPEARRSLIAKGNRLLPVPEGFYLLAPGRWLPFLASPLVSWRGKARMALDLLLPRRRSGGDESLAAFVRRRLGREALARIAQPLVAGITTADPERLSVAAAFPQLLEMEAEHRSLLLAMRARSRAARARGESDASGARYGLFATLAGGLGRLIERLRERLGDCELRTGVRVERIIRDGDGFRLATSAGELPAGRVALALPANAAAPLAAMLDAELGARLAEVPYAGVAVANLAWDRADCAPPEAAGFVVPAIEGRRLIAASCTDRKFPGRAPADRTLLRAFVGGALGEQTLSLGDGELLAAVQADLRVLLGAIGPPQLARVTRHPAAMAQHVLGHRERVAALRAREAGCPGLGLVGNGYEGQGIPDVCAQADALAERWCPAP
jgi:oxygen-dependent protoporphyrinogen oxidase